MNKKMPNIYHILFDGFNSLAFLKALKDSGDANAFNGFTFFKKNRANYDDTFASNSSLRSGSFYSGGPFKMWDDVQLNPGIFQQMNQYGYQLNQYTDSRNIFYKNAVQIKFNDDMLDHYKSKTSSMVKLLKRYNHFTKYILSERIGKGTRLALSQIIKPFNIWLKNNNGFPSFPLDRFFLSDFTLSLPMMLDFINTEKKRPASGHYNFAHIMLPHSPFNWSRSLEFTKSSYEEQVYASLHLMKLLIDDLKQLGRFNDSLIIFHSDHGWSDVDFKYPYLDKIPKKMLNKIENTINHPPSRFLHRSHALLMIKPPNVDSMHPLEISDRLTQLADIPSTISHLLDWDIQTPEGCSVFSENWDHNRELHMFTGLHKYNKMGLKCDFGIHYLKGELAHFSINPNNKWKIYPDLPISWN